MTISSTWTIEELEILTLTRETDPALQRQYVTEELARRREAVARFMPVGFIPLAPLPMRTVSPQDDAGESMRRRRAKAKRRAAAAIEHARALEMERAKAVAFIIRCGALRRGEAAKVEALKAPEPAPGSIVLAAVRKRTRSGASDARP